MGQKEISAVSVPFNLCVLYACAHTEHTKQEQSSFISTLTNQANYVKSSYAPQFFFARTLRGNIDFLYAHQTIKEQ